MPLPLALLGAAPGLIKAAGSVFGSKKRKAAEADAQSRATDADQQLKDFEFTNPYANQENTAEDLTVNQQATNVQAQQTDSALSSGLDAITAGGGGGGGAQAIANAALQSKQGISSDIAGQESQNQQLRAQQAASNQTAEAQGATTLQNQQYGQAGQELDIANTQLGAAKDARAKSQADLVGGLSSAAGAVTKGPGGGALGKLFKRESPLARLKSQYQSPFKTEKDAKAPQAKTYNDAYNDYETITERQQAKKADRFAALNDSNLGGSFSKVGEADKSGFQGYRDRQSGKKFSVNRRGEFQGDQLNNKFLQGIEERIQGGVNKQYGNQFESEQAALGNRPTGGNHGKTVQQEIESDIIAKGGSLRDAQEAGGAIASEDRKGSEARYNARKRNEYGQVSDEGAAGSAAAGNRDDVKESALPRSPLYRHYKKKYKGMFK